MADEEKQETQRIFLTLPKRYVDILELIGSGDKSTAAREIIHDYIHLRKERFIDEGTWDSIQSTLLGIPLQKNIGKMISDVDGWLKDQEDWIKNHETSIEFQEGIRKFKNAWYVVKTNKIEEKIKKYHGEIMQISDEQDDVNLIKSIMKKSK